LRFFYNLCEKSHVNSVISRYGIKRMENSRTGVLVFVKVKHEYVEFSSMSYGLQQEGTCVRVAKTTDVLRKLASS
jgi:hypothetical protein